MAKLTKSQWVDIRNLWEGDPCLSFGVLANQYGVTKQTICSRSKNENWQKKGNLTHINREAIRRADALTDSVKTDEKTDDKGKTDDTPRLKGDDEAVDRRVGILVKHRHEIVTLDSMQNEAMTLFSEAMEARITAADADDDQKVKTAKNLWWQAKIAADIAKDHCAAIKIKHAAERVAWSMDEGELSQADIEACSEEELDYYLKTHKLPLRLRKLIRGYDDR